jgi:glucosamine-6-phosphate deaminase
MADSVTGVRADAVAEREARDRSPSRGPSRVPHIPAGLERIRTLVVDDHEHIARLVANRIATLVREKDAAGETAVLGLATGSTPIGVYRELIRMHREEELSFRHVVTFNLDEYYPMPRESIHSYHRFMWENLFSHIDIRPENVHIPDGTVPPDRVEEFCRRYEDAIADAGGIDFQILGIGKTGHIGFNEPGSGADRRHHAPRRRCRLFRRGVRATRGDHDGRGDDPRCARDRDPRDGRAQVDDRQARRRG